MWAYALCCGFSGYYFLFFCYFLLSFFSVSIFLKLFFFLGARMASSEIEEEQTGDNDSAKAPGEEIVTTLKPPLTFLSIFKDAKIPINTSDPGKLCEMLSKGVFLENYAGVPLHTTKPLVRKNIVSSISLSPDLISISWTLSQNLYIFNILGWS